MEEVRLGTLRLVEACGVAADRADADGACLLLVCNLPQSKLRHGCCTASKKVADGVGEGSIDLEDKRFENNNLGGPGSPPKMGGPKKPVSSKAQPAQPL